MLSANVTRGRMWQYDATQWVKPKTDDEDTADGTGRMEGEDKYLDEAKYEDAECAKCHSCLYIACVRCQCDPSQVCCHKHFAQFCECPVANKWFEFRFSLTWFEDILRALTAKVNAVTVDNEYNEQELFTDGSGKNYEILSKSTDAGIVKIACNTTMRGMRETFIDRFGQILGGYTNELVRKLHARFPKLAANVLSQEELNHLCHACECVVWANFEDADTNSNLVEVRRYFEILCDYNNVTKILMDTFTNYSNVQSFYNKLQELQGEYDKIQLQILLQNQPRFPKKLSMSAIEVALQRAQNNEIKVEMAQILHKMPSILSFMHQQQEILQNALNGILTTTWANKQSLIVQARSIVNFIPGNFADSYWRYLGNKNIVNSKTNAINNNTCLVLPILSWLLNEFERGILGSIDCDAMNAIKQVISKGNMIQLQINKFCAKENNDCWLTQSELENVIKTCGNLHLRLPFYDLMKIRYEKYNEWDCKTLLILNKEEKCSYAVINTLVRQYSQNRIFNKNGDILKIKFLSPIRKWINNAKALLDGNVSQCHDLLIEFEEYAEIMNDTPKEYGLLLQYVGISSWINSVETQLKYNNHNIEQLAQLIENGKHFNIKKTVKLIDLLRERLDKLQSVYAQCEDQFVCIQNKDKTYDLSQYNRLIQTAQDLHIDIDANHKLMQIQQHIVAIEKWETYLQNKISKLLSKNTNNNNKNGRKRTYSEFDENHDLNQENKYLNGAYKRRKQNDSNNTNTFWWKTAMNGYCFDYKQNEILTQRQDENDIIDSIQELLEKSLLIAAKSPLENTAKLMLNNIRECMIECNRFIDKINEDVNVLIDINLDEIIKIKENVQRVQVLSNTLIEFKINTLHWRWHAMHYLNGINNNESDWDLAKLFSEGNRLGLNNDNKEWQKISAIYEDLSLFDSVCLDLFVSGNADCKMLLLLNEKIQNKQNDLNVVNIIQHCIDNKYMNNLDVAISQIAKISERIEIFSDFYDKNFISSILSYSNLEILSSEMGLLAQCLNVDSIPHFNSIKSTDVYMENILTKLDNLYWDRPHGDKCDLVKWINFTFMQFNIMYCNNGIIQMDKYRLNAGNHCYCFCRFTYTVSMKEKNEPIPEMIGCEECAEWYHAECIMLDDKQMRKFFNSKRLKFICPRCCYYEYNDCYKYFPSLHWNQMELVKLSDLENVLANNGDAGDVILCHCPVINGVNRLISWIKIWQMDVNNFLNVICLTHNVLSDFTNEEVFITEYLLNCGQICGIFTLELLSLKILQRFIGKSTIYNNHNGARQLSLHEIELSFTQQLLRKYEAKSKLLNDFILTTCNDIENSKKILYEVYMDLYFIKAVGIHYITYMRRKKKGPLKVKLILRRLNTLIKLDLNQCPKLLHDKHILDEKGDNYVNEEFTSHDTEWLKYVNESVSMKKSDKKQCKAKWAERLNAHKSNLMDKYKNSRLRIQSVVITLDLIDKLVEG